MISASPEVLELCKQVVTLGNYDYLRFGVYAFAAGMVFSTVMSFVLSYVTDWFSAPSAKHLDKLCDDEATSTAADAEEEQSASRVRHG